MNTAMISSFEEKLSAKELAALEAEQKLDAKEGELKQAILDATDLHTQLDNLKELFHNEVKESDEILQEKVSRINVLREQLVVLDVVGAMDNIFIPETAGDEVS